MNGKRLAGVLATLARNGALARIQAAFLISTVVEWAAWLALIVIAFERGGAAEAGLIGFAVGLPAIVIAPTTAILGDRWPRSRVMVAAYLAQAVALGSTALAFAAGAGVLGYALGITASGLVALVRPLLGSLLPEIARTPEELTAANVTSGISEGAGAMIGAFGAGLLFAVAGAPAVLALGAGGMVVAAALVLPVAIRARAIPLDAIRAANTSLATTARAVGHELAAGAATVLADRRLTVLNVLMAVTIGSLGALSVLIVVVAIDVLGFDSDAAGYLTAVGGLGALLGSIAASSLVGRERLALPLLASVVGFAVAVAAVGLSDAPLPVIVAILGTGIGWSVAWVAATTLTQRLAGDNVMTRVFGVSESVQTGAEAIGGLLVPLLVVAVGPTGALVSLGVFLVAVAGLSAPTLLRSDRVDPAFLRDLAVVRAVPMFAPLSGPVLERLAAGAEHVTVPPGAEVIRQGESGDRFYVIASGRVRVTTNDHDVGELGPGDSFGEIALLREVPRTATVQAVEPTDLLAIEREPFLEALTGQPRSRVIAADLVLERLAADRAAAGDG
jgi:MFS family permease